MKVMSAKKATSNDPLRDIPYYLRAFQHYIGWRLYLFFALTLFAVIAEGFGLLMLLPLLASLDGAAEDPTGVAGQIQNGLAALGLADSFVAVLLIIMGAFLLKGALLIGANAYKAYLRAQLLREIKGRLFDCYIRMQYRHYVGHSTGHFINVINAQINGLLNSFTALVQLLSHLINAVVYTATAMLVAWRFGLLAAVAGVVILLLFKRLNIYVRDLSRLQSSEASHLSKLLIQFLHGFKYLTATGQARPLQTPVQASIHRVTGYQFRQGALSAVTNGIKEPIIVLMVTGIVLVEVLMLGGGLAPIIVALVLFNRAMNAVLSIQPSWQSVLSKIGSLEMVDREFRDQAIYQEHDGERTAPALNDRIVLDNVSFAYNADHGYVLRDVSLTIPVRTSVALVGESGAGKSTLVDLLTLMLKPQFGQVWIDGVLGDQVALNTWRSQIGYVSQETVVFDDTIANNICMWAGDAERDEALVARIREAARRAHIHHHIETLPEGYHTVVGDRGIRLSGGQRQRLFIARELFRRPNLLILDEATSALDTDSERHIQASIDALKGEITVVIIAHRLSTIRNVDHVYVFDQGRLVEDGSFEHLKDQEDSKFGRLVAAQAL